MGSFGGLRFGSCGMGSFMSNGEGAREGGGIGEVAGAWEEGMGMWEGKVRLVWCLYSGGVVYMSG